MPASANTPMQPGFRPEARLLLAVASEGKESDRHSRIRTLLEEEIDWDLLLRLALHNRVHTLLYWNLNAISPENVPPEIMEQLRSGFFQNSVRNMFYLKELVGLLELFRGEAIRALPYKGPLLASSIYENLGLRQFWDLDILVHKEDVLKVKDLLLSRGYKPEKEMSRAEEQALLDSDCEYNFDDPERGIHLEIHWHILPEPFSSSFDSDYVWDRAVSVELVNTTMLTLPPEVTFLILCMHGGDKHQWARLKWICDIARFVDIHREIDWNTVLDDAVRLGCMETVALGLHLAELLLGASLPAAVVSRMRQDARRSGLAALVRARLFREDFGLPGFFEWFSYLAEEDDHRGTKKSALRRWFSVFMYLRAVMRPEFRDRYTMALPPWLSFLSYPYRIWRVTREHKGDLISRLR